MAPQEFSQKRGSQHSLSIEDGGGEPAQCSGGKARRPGVRISSLKQLTVLGATSSTFTASGRAWARAGANYVATRDRACGISRGRAGDARDGSRIR